MAANNRLQPETKKQCQKRWELARPGRKSSSGKASLCRVAAASGEEPVGDFTIETLTLGDSPPVRGVAVGYGHNNEVLFVGAAGCWHLAAVGRCPSSHRSRRSGGAVALDEHTAALGEVEQQRSPSSDARARGGNIWGSARAAPFLGRRMPAT
jgi:hypothetical protein